MNEQESFWAGKFGDDYTGRNTGLDLIASNLCLFSRILERARRIGSVLELGANQGLNLKALRHLLPDASQEAVEINQQAFSCLQALPGVQAHHSAIAEWRPTRTYDFVLCKGILIHINPEQLPQVYEVMHQAAGRYICVAEYFNPTPVVVSYRGETDKLFKRDFAGELLSQFPDLALVDYGFASRRSANFPQDDFNWYLLEKT